MQCVLAEANLHSHVSVGRTDKDRLRSMFFLEQGALDYIARVEAHTKPQAAPHTDVELAVSSSELVQAAPALGKHQHVHLNVLHAAQVAHEHAHLCGDDKANKDGFRAAIRTPSQQMVLCMALEFSIIVHSLIIGCAFSVFVGVLIKSLTVCLCLLSLACACSFEMGLNPDNSTLVGLVVVLCFHQFFEGLGLGSYIGHMAG